MAALFLLCAGARANAAEYSVYEVFRAIDLGESDRQPPRKFSSTWVRFRA